MDLASKKVFVEDLNGKVANSVVVVIAEYSGITVEQINDLRVLAKEAKIKVKVCKNSLFLRAIENSEFKNLTEDLSGPNIFIMSDDLIGAAKLVTNFADNNELFKVKNGSFNGDLLDKDSIVALSKMLSLDELRAKIISVINTPATNIARMVKEPAAKVVRVVDAYSKQSN
ncbi:MAG: 50S ribosomal protein L10 [Rickettsiales bacterium]|jgi:large subunit ribosomal protein L10|nr:50S ribosomal protein L10 [Rickettsiales bacterium]